MGQYPTQKIIVLGAGITGLSTAYFLKKSYSIFEKNDKVGGLCHSKTVHGYTFDFAEHFFRVPNDKIKSILKSLLKKNLFSQYLRASIYIFDRFINYPFQKNLYGLPSDIIVECLAGFIKARNNFNKNYQFQNFKDWIIGNFGEGISKYFMLPYNTKIWAVTPEKMSIDWFFDSSVIHVPDMGDIIGGAKLPPKKRKVKRQVRWYPKIGGAESLGRSFLPYIKNLELETEVTEISLSENEIIFQDNSIKYEHLISTIPLKDLINIIKNVPPNIKDAAKKLNYNSVLCVNFGVNKKSINPNHWIYFPEDEFIFSRLYFPMNFSSWMVPKGKSSIGAVITYPETTQINIEKIKERTLEGIIQAGILREADQSKIEVIDIMDIKYGYTIPELNLKENLETIQKYLKEYNIYSIGRYGDWKYSGIEHAIMDGMEMANQINRDESI